MGFPMSASAGVGFRKIACGPLVPREVFIRSRLSARAPKPAELARRVRLSSLSPVGRASTRLYYNKSH